MTLDEVRAEIAEHLEQISSLFQPGIKLTLVARMPFAPEGNLILTDDNLNATIRAIEEALDQGILTPADASIAKQLPSVTSRPPSRRRGKAQANQQLQPSFQSYAGAGPRPLEGKAGSPIAIPGHAAREVPSSPPVSSLDGRSPR